MSAISDVLSVQLLQQWSLSAVISHLLTFTVIFLSVVLLHDALVRSKRLNTSWRSPSRDKPPSPPGPWWNLPLVGYLPWLGPKPHVTLWNLSRRYGDVFQIRFGGRKVVVLSGRETIREALVQQGDVFASFAAFCEGRSLAFNSLDADWIIQHKVYTLI